MAGRGACAAAVDVPRVVLDARAEPDLPHHLDVVVGAHPQALGLQQLALPLELGQPLLQLLLDRRDRVRHPLRTGHVVRGREDAQRVDLAHDVTGQRVHVVQRLDLVAEVLDAHGEFLVRRDDLDGVTAHPERSPGERHVVAVVLHVDQQPQQAVTRHLVADLELHRPVQVGLRRAEAVDAGHRRHHDDVAPGQQARGRRVPQPLDVVVDRAVLLDVGVGLGDVRLGLVVVVVRHEVLDGVVRQHLPQFIGQLRSQRLVRRHHQGGPLQPFDEPRRGGRLAGAGGTEEHDVALARSDALLEFLDGGGLIACGRNSLTTSNSPPARTMSSTARYSECARTGYSVAKAMFQLRTMHRQADSRSVRSCPPPALYAGPIHPPKLETFDVAARTNTDPKGIVRAVDVYSVKPWGLYMARPTPGRDQFHYLESWLLPATGAAGDGVPLQPRSRARPGLLPRRRRFTQPGGTVWTPRTTTSTWSCAPVVGRPADRRRRTVDRGAARPADAGNRRQAVQTAIATIDGLASHDYHLERLADLAMVLTWQGA